MSYKKYKEAVKALKGCFDGLRMGIRKWYSFGIHRFITL